MSNAFLIVRENEQWRPASTLIQGTYNRLGIVDEMIVPQRIQTYFETDKELATQDFLNEVARGGVRYKGAHVDVFLAHSLVVRGAVGEMRSDKSVRTYSTYDGVENTEVYRLLFRDLLFDGLAPGAEMVERVSELLCETAAFFEWMKKHGTWTPNTPDGQHVTEDVRARFAAAREKVAGRPKLVKSVERAIADTELRWEREQKKR